MIQHDSTCQDSWYLPDMLWLKTRVVSEPFLTFLLLRMSCWRSMARRFCGRISMTSSCCSSEWTTSSPQKSPLVAPRYHGIPWHTMAWPLGSCCCLPSDWCWESCWERSFNWGSTQTKARLIHYDQLMFAASFLNQPGVCALSNLIVCQSESTSCFLHLFDLCFYVPSDG